ncbi:COG1361 S-layer family protein [Archaeoglobus neptunius]|uniref:COG1361 S-layer family protein n=1 Tax=Archaeoglobus neptunius TaxID=2798580 RepID=UPI0019286152|nr:COG1361 S-layer family protein [Archaeoglobus neptunius]
MRKLILALFVLFVTVIHCTYAASVSVSYTITPEVLLPGDYADITLTLTNPTTKDVTVNSVVLKSNDLKVEPKSIYSVGTIPPGGSYSLSFSVKANEKGRYNLEVDVSLENGSLTQNIQIVVDDSFPSLVITSPLYEGEVNDLKFYVSSPVELKDVKVEALFNAVPKIAYIGTVYGGAEGTFKFIPTSDTLRFRISFYNGRNFHEVVKVVKINLLKAKDVELNVTPPYRSLFIGDSITIPVEITNLRNDEISGLTVRAKSELGTFTYPAEIAMLQPGESKTVDFKFSPSKSGNGNITFILTYSDQFGNVYTTKRSFSVNVVDSYAVKLTNIKVNREGLQTSVSGDVSNNGRSTVYNAYAVAKCGEYRTDYFIGNIDPSDFQSFDLPVKCNRSVLITVSWSNAIGESFEIHKTVDLAEELPGEVETSNLPLIISAIAAVAVVTVVGYIVYRQLKK